MACTSASLRARLCRTGLVETRGLDDAAPTGIGYRGTYRTKGSPAPEEVGRGDRDRGGWPGGLVVGDAERLRLGRLPSRVTDRLDVRSRSSGAGEPGFGELGRVILVIVISHSGRLDLDRRPRSPPGSRDAGWRARTGCAGLFERPDPPILVMRRFLTRAFVPAPAENPALRSSSDAPCAAGRTSRSRPRPTPGPRTGRPAPACGRGSSCTG